MISEDTKAMFHRLDEETVVEERYFETGLGKRMSMLCAV